MTSRRDFLVLGLAFMAGDCATAAGERPRLSGPAPIPFGYRYVAHAQGVPAEVLYAIALQESQMRFGDAALPYPWTLNIEGSPKRFDSYQESVAALIGCLRSKVLSVDCGLLQINWKYHHRKLQSPARALDPYPNITVGAQLLRLHFTKAKSWFQAVAHYHNADPVIGQRYAASVFGHLARIPRSAS